MRSGQNKRKEVGGRWVEATFNVDIRFSLRKPLFKDSLRSISNKLVTKLLKITGVKIWLFRFAFYLLFN